MQHTDPDVTEAARDLFRQQANRTGEHIKKQILIAQNFRLIDTVILFTLVTMASLIYISFIQCWHREVYSYGTVEFATTPLFVNLNKNSTNSALHINVKVGQKIRLGEAIAEQINTLSVGLNGQSRVASVIHSPTDGTVVNMRVFDDQGLKSEPFIVIKPKSEDLVAEFTLKDSVSMVLHAHQIVGLLTLDTQKINGVHGEVVKIFADPDVNAATELSSPLIHILVAIRPDGTNSTKILSEIQGRRVKILTGSELYSLASILKLNSRQSTKVSY